MIELLNIDCMQYMATLEDNAFDLAIVDPPYGIGASKTKKTAKRREQNYITIYKAKDWDKNTPTKEYFNELFRVSKNQIVWGGNYFKYLAKKNTPNLKTIGEFNKYMTESNQKWIFWDKQFSEDFSFAAGELAWTSLDRDLKKFTYGYWNCKNNISNNNVLAKANARIHPTQKPIQLYKWLLDNYAKEGDKILDTHLGSGSIAIACHDYKFNLVGCEIDKDYYDSAVKRYNNHKAQTKLF